MTLIVLIILVCVVLAQNLDPFRPSCWLVLTIITFFSAGLLSGGLLLNGVIYLIFITLIIMILIEELFSEKYKAFYQNIKVYSKRDLAFPEFAKCMFVSSIFLFLSIIAQYKLISHSGDLVSYFLDLNNRVKNWAGLGLYVELTKLCVYVSPIVFGYWLSLKKKTFVTTLFFLAFLFTTIFISLLSGGRGRLLGILVSHIFVFHYCINFLKTRTLMMIAGAGIIFSAFAQFVRHSIQGDELNLSLGFEWSSFWYGTFPLIEAENFNGPLHYGSTYASLLGKFLNYAGLKTNWESGGVVFTKWLQGDAYLGTSQFTPGVFVEGIMNFGQFYGIIFSAVLLIITMYISYFFYIKLLDNRGCTIDRLKSTSYYLYASELVPGIINSEFTNLVFTKAYVFIFLIIFFKLLKTKYRI